MEDNKVYLEAEIKIDSSIFVPMIDASSESVENESNLSSSVNA